MKKILVVLMLCSVFSSAQKNKDDLYGFNTNTLFIFLEVYDTNNLNLVTQINPKVLRFPGGYGNFYHLNGVGYGFNYTEAIQKNSGDLPQRLKGLNRIIQRKNTKKNYLEDFIYLAKQLGSKVIIDANILTASFAETAKMISKIQESGLKIRGVEIGSELYNASFSKSIDGAQYVELAREFTDKLSILHPEIDIAVVVAPLNRNYKRHDDWNNLLAAEDFYDAIIIHTYAKVIKGVDLEGKMIKEMPEHLNIKVAFDIYKARILKFLYESYEKEIISYSQIFPKKPIWVTEWNLQMSKTTGNTMFQSLFVSAYILELLNNDKLDVIELSIYHNLVGRDVSGSVFRNINKGLEIHSTFNSFKIIKKVFEKKMISISRKKINEYCYEYLCLFQDASEKYIWINWSDQNININLTKEMKFSKIDYFGEQLFSKNTEKGSLQYIELKNNYTNMVTLSPYSVTIIENIMK